MPLLYRAGESDPEQEYVCYPPGHGSGDVLGNRAVFALSRCCGHMGMDRQAHCRAGS